jgi:HSP20 family protein
MLTFYDGWDRNFDELRRQLGQLFDEFDASPWTNPSLFGGTQVWPRVNLADHGADLVLTADVPGLSEKDVQVSIEQDVLTISGERKLNAPEGFAAHRQERGSYKFTRSFNLPARVDNDKVNANVKQGVLTVTLPKTAEAQPRRIEIRGT